MDNIVLYYTSSTGCTSRSLLLKAIEKHYGISEDKLELVHEYGRKPYFASHPYIHFSISHSGDIWGVVFSGKEVGLDIQYPNPSVTHKKIAKRYFHPDERLFSTARTFIISGRGRKPSASCSVTV